VAERAERFTEALDRAGRAPGSAARHLHLDAAPTYSLTSVERFRDAVGRAREHGFTDVLAHWPRADGPHAGRESVLERVAADVLPELVGQAPGSS
jgi:hypothetical protein